MTTPLNPQLFDDSPYKVPQVPSTGSERSTWAKPSDRKAEAPRQQILDPHGPLEISPVTGFIDVSPGYSRAMGKPENMDPDYDFEMYSVGGMKRGSIIEDVWKQSPVEDFAPDAQIRTGQSRVDRTKVGRIKKATGMDALPWVGRVAGKNYLLEGHHRAVAAREEGKSFPAHVISAGSRQELLSGIDSARNDIGEAHFHEKQRQMREQVDKPTEPD